MFNPVVTTARDFTIHRGPQIVEELIDTGTVIGGLLRGAKSRGAEVLPVLAATACPGGPVEHELFRDLSEEILAAAVADVPDLVLLDLHGAMVTTAEIDPEGWLLRQLRDRLKTSTIIAVGLDLHAYVTDAMFEATTFLLACKHNPHTDFYETGVKVADLAFRIFEGGADPTTIATKVPMLLAGNTETSSGPLWDAHAIAGAAVSAHPEILDISIFNCQPFIDVPNPGQIVTAIMQGHSSAAVTCVEAIGSLLWERRAEFRNEFPSIECALDEICADQVRRPFVVSDYGDRVLAGAPGDSAAILRALKANSRNLKAAIPIVAPDVVAMAQAVGVGGEISATVGGYYTPAFEKLAIEGRVRLLGDGEYVLRGPMMAGQRVSAGDLAVIEAGFATIIALSRTGYTHDSAFFESVGLSISAYDFVVVKSGNHFQPSFEGIATPLKVDTPGVGSYRPGQFTLHRTPVYPEVDTKTFKAVATAVRERAIATAQLHLSHREDR